MSQGRSGSMATIHADSSAGAFRRLASYAVQAPERLPLEATNLLIAGSIHLIVHLESRQADSRWQGARRFVSSVREVVDADGPLVVSNEIWQPGPSGRAVIASAPSERTIRALESVGHEWTGHDSAGRGGW
jgi:pilus assembly protein CpaF